MGDQLRLFPTFPDPLDHECGRSITHTRKRALVGRWYRVAQWTTRHRMDPVSSPWLLGAARVWIQILCEPQKVVVRRRTTGYSCHVRFDGATTYDVDGESWRHQPYGLVLVADAWDDPQLACDIHAVLNARDRGIAERALVRRKKLEVNT